MSTSEYGLDNLPKGAIAPLAQSYRRVIQLASGFRLLVSGILLWVSLAFISEPIVGQVFPTMFRWTCACYVVAAVALLSIGTWDRSEFIWLHGAVDLVAVAFLTYASGGTTGIGGLLVVAAGTIALVAQGRWPYLYASAASLVLLGTQAGLVVRNLSPSSEFAAAGMLGAIIFVMTATVQTLRRRATEAEALVRQVGIDLANLSELNAYIIQHLRESIVVVDEGDRIRLINESAEQHLGKRRGVVGQLLSGVAPELHRRLQEWRAGKTDSNGTAIRSADGSSDVTVNFATLSAERDGPLIIFLEDATLLAEKVQQSKLAALGRLSASIAHEIRNPVGAMSHAGQLLAESPNVSGEETRLTDIIQKNADRVSEIVDSVLSLSRRDAVKPEIISLRAWLKEFAQEFVTTLELEPHALSIAGDEVEARIDPTHLRQVVWNLADNALKYASETAGIINVELTTGRLSTSGRPFLDVADRGPGVSAKEGEAIFEPFFTAGRGGTGLGLFICRELCECNGATLRYEQRDGGGSVFRIVFADPGRWRSER